MVDTYDEILEANRAYVASGQHRALGVRPARQLAVITCMDARIAAFPVLGLELGDAHVIRTAGARVTDDVLRSLALSTHVLGTRRALVVGHTRCALYDPDGTIGAARTELMGRPPFNQARGTFTGPEATVPEDCQRLLVWPGRPDGFIVAGYLLDVDTGELQPIVPPTEAAPAERPPA